METKMGKEKIPNEITRKTIEDSEKGIGLKRVNTVEELFKELNEESRDGSRVIKDDD